MRALIVAALLATITLAGCVSPTAASDLQSAAEREAARTHADPVLVGILGAEWTNDSLVTEVSEESPEAEALAEQGVDPNPGDGLANAWAYFFDTEEGGLIVVVGADGSIMDTQELEDVSEGSQSFGFEHAIGDYSVDSDEAAAIVAENHDRFSDVAMQDDALVMMILVHDEEFLEGTFWSFFAITAEGEDFVFAVVDAEDGSYQDFSQFMGG